MQILINYIQINLFLHLLIIFLKNVCYAHIFGIENINYNPYNNKHKSTKVSLIIDEYNIPINITINNCKQNDSSILNYQLDILQNKHLRRKCKTFSLIDIRKNALDFF